MPKHVDSVVIREPIKKQVLTLEFDEGDNVLAGIKQALIDNRIRETDVVDVSGFLGTFSINTFEGNKFKRIDLSNQEILRASGHFKMGGEDLWGSFNIFTSGRKPFSGTVISAKASQGFTLKLSFLP